MRSSSDMKYVIRCCLLIHHYLKTGFLLLLVSGIVILLDEENSLGQAHHSIAADILYNYFNARYKLDQNLINGVKYYKPHEAVSGNEFLLDDKSSRGSITVNGKKYENVFLKYDIFNQNVILEYDYPPGGKLQIIIDNEKITEFEIFEKRFRKYYFPSTGNQFFQILSAGNLVCLVYWIKIKVPAGSSLDYAYQYSEEKKKNYLLVENELHQFGGQKSFLKLFPDLKDEIKKYIKRHDLEIRNISDKDLIGLFKYCHDLASNDSVDTIR
jgi:hypothetical protein